MSISFIYHPRCRERERMLAVALAIAKEDGVFLSANYVTKGSVFKGAPVLALAASGSYLLADTHSCRIRCLPLSEIDGLIKRFDFG